MAGQHDINQGGQFPEKWVALYTKSNGPTVDIGHGNSDADQGHHARYLLPYLIEQPFQKRPSTIEEYETRQDKEYVLRTRNQECETQELLNQRRKNKNRYRHDDRHIESSAEITDHHPVVLCMIVVIVLVIVLCAMFFHSETHYRDH